MANPEQSTSKEKSAAAATGKGRIDIESKLKLLREAGIPTVDGSSDGIGGIVICGIGREPSTRASRIKEFTRHLRLMSRRAKGGDCYTVFKIEGKRRSRERFIQFWFHSVNSFYLELPNTTLTAGEAEKLLSNRAGFYFVSYRPPIEDSDLVQRFNPMHRDYQYGEEKIAAEDITYIVFDLWKQPVDISLEIEAARP